MQLVCKFEQDWNFFHDATHLNEMVISGAVAFNGQWLGLFKLDSHNCL